MTKRGFKREGPWWDITTAWKVASEGLEHGAVEDATAAFALQHDVTADTLRRYAAARRFVEEIAAGGHGLSLEKLSLVRLASLGVLQRMRHHGDGQILPNLRRLVAGKMTHEELLEAEARLRSAAGAKGAPSRAAENRHAFRVRKGEFKGTALAAFKQTMPEGYEMVAKVIPHGHFEPLFVDAFARDAAGVVRIGVRLLGAVATSAEPDRMRLAIVLAMAAARVFPEYSLLAQSRDDAMALARGIEAVGAAGVRVLLLDEQGKIEMVRDEPRGAPPDLAKHAYWAERFAPPPPPVVPGGVTSAVKRRSSGT